MKTKLEILLRVVEQESQDESLVQLSDESAKNLVFASGGTSGGSNNSSCTNNTSCTNNNTCSGNGTCSANKTCI